MKIIAFIAACASLVLCSFRPAPGAGVQVKITGIEGNKGQLALLIFNASTGFPSDHTKALKQAMIPISGTTVTYTFADLPTGTYAITVMHDENKNNTLDTNMFGIPEEGIGVSNNALSMFGPPSFKECAFNHNGTSSTVEIKLDY
ncbi:MAG: DUF2141 domain-containing protein [Flavobacteriales bacterium]|jgi:uncharacterized protein (DUF2141 family)